MRTTLFVVLAAVASFAAGVLVEHFLLVRVWPRLSTSEAAPPELLSPAAGAVLGNGWQEKNPVWEFRWSEVPRAERYQLHVIGPGSTAPAVEVTVEEARFEHTNRTVFADGYLEGWNWKVRVQVGGRWSGWSDVRTFDLRKSVWDEIPTREEVVAYLIGKSVDLPSPEKPPRPHVIANQQVEALEVAQSVSGLGIRVTPVSFILSTTQGRFAVTGIVQHSKVEQQRVFHGFEVRKVSKQ